MTTWLESVRMVQSLWPATGTDEQGEDVIALLKQFFFLAGSAVLDFGRWEKDDGKGWEWHVALRGVPMSGPSSSI